MRIRTKMIAAAAAALSLAAMAAPTHAAVFAQWTPTSSRANFLWQNNAAGNLGTGGSFFTTATNTSTTLGATSIFFTLFDNPDLTNLAAKLTFSGTATATPAAYTPGPNTYTETHINGSFSIIYAGVGHLFGSTWVATGSNLLSGTFHNAWLQGAGGSGGIDVALAQGGSANFTSAFDTFSHAQPGSDEFAFHIGALAPGITQQTLNTTALKTFRGNVGGNFSYNAIPEPASWALMIVGFGGVGAMLRSRRRFVGALA